VRKKKSELVAYLYIFRCITKSHRKVYFINYVLQKFKLDHVLMLPN